jgi:hypothetical protein
VREAKLEKFAAFSVFLSNTRKVINRSSPPFGTSCNSFPHLQQPTRRFSMEAVAKLRKHLIYGGLLLVLLLALPSSAKPQSTEATAPTPISANDLSGSIAARDIGDSRFTHHFYAFSGNPGDVLITVQSRNLNGDVDVFTAGTLRPLLKFTLYAESSSPVTKGIYLRKHEDLILRVEARSPNDDEGSYQIRFGGSFEPVAAPLVAEAEKAEPAPETATRRTGRRVTSAGARINEPPPPPEEVAVVAPTPSPSPKATPEEVAEAAPPRSAPTRRGRGRAATRRSQPQPAPTSPDKKEPTGEVKEPEQVAITTEPEPAKPARRTGRRGARPPVAAPVEPEPPSGPRLVLEMLDGTRTERFMSTIRRVTIENNQIVVVGKDGKIDRKRMSEVVRMTIEP